MKKIQWFQKSQILKKIQKKFFLEFLIFFPTDMQKFPLRMKDNDLLVTELYRDPTNDQITSISVYLTPKTTSEYLRQSFSPQFALYDKIKNDN